MKIPLPLQVFFQCLIVVLSTWAREGFASSSNTILQKNRRFMHHPTLIEELLETGEVLTTMAVRGLEIPTTYTRAAIEAVDVPIQLFRRPNISPQEINRLVTEAIETGEYKLEKEKKSLSALERIEIRNQVTKDLSGQSDTQAIEGVALSVAPAAPEKLLTIFLKLDQFQNYVPDVFLSSHQMTLEELQSKGIKPHDHLRWQYSRTTIGGVEFSQTLRYEISREQETLPTGTTLETIHVAWEIDPLYKFDPTYGSDGVLVNSGHFKIQPYVTNDFQVDPTRSMILYHIYIKVDPQNYLVNVLSDLFSESEARAVLRALATHMRREALHE